MSKLPLHIVRLPRVSPTVMLHLEEALMRYDTQERNFLILNRPLAQHRSVILGISGKPEKLVNLEAAKKDNIPLIKRFTGGGTVYINETIRFNGFIINKQDLPDLPPYPTDIMKWTEGVYKNVFDNMLQKHHTNNTEENKARFSLVENDYCFDKLKFGGNAQSIIRNRWVHHTSFLWDLDVDSISNYLTLPEKRPDYRGTRSHRDFLCDMRPTFETPETTLLRDRTVKSRYVDDGDEMDVDNADMFGGCKYTHEYDAYATNKASQQLDSNDMDGKPSLFNALKHSQNQEMMHNWITTMNSGTDSRNSVNQDNMFHDNMLSTLEQLFDVKIVDLNDLEETCAKSMQFNLNTKIVHQ